MNREITVKLSEALYTMMRECESYCVAGCCGVDAYEISAEALRRWAKLQAPDFLAARREELLQLLATFRSHNGLARVESLDLNDTKLASDWIQWFEQWLAALDQATGATDRKSP